jgi:CRP/FNR family cyclic AMP-dependent transcriptional regulator
MSPKAVSGGRQLGYDPRRMIKPVRSTEGAMSLLPDLAEFQKRLSALPVATYQAGDSVLTAGEKTGQLLILKQGAVSITKESVEIAKVTEVGSVFGELSALLEQPHTADVRALETSEFHVAEAATLLAKDPTVLLYVAALLAKRLDRANGAVIELRNQFQEGQPPGKIRKAIQKLQEVLGPAGANLVYAGHPFNPYM